MRGLNSRGLLEMGACLRIKIRDKKNFFNHLYFSGLFLQTNNKRKYKDAGQLSSFATIDQFQSLIYIPFAKTATKSFINKTPARISNDMFRFDFLF